MDHFGEFLKPLTCGQTVLPDRSVSIGQKLVENAKIKKFKCDILSNFQTMRTFFSLKQQNSPHISVKYGNLCEASGGPKCQGHQVNHKLRRTPPTIRVTEEKGLSCMHSTFQIFLHPISSSVSKQNSYLCVTAASTG